jgi:hypothetical protein
MEDAEEHIGRVAPHHLRRIARRSRRQPGAYRPHGHPLARDRPALDQRPADRPVGMPVLPGIAQAKQPPVVQPHTARALHMQEKGVDRIVHPSELQPEPRQSARLDRGTVGPRAIKERRWRQRVQRHPERAHRVFRPAQLRFVIAGHQPGPGGKGPKATLEKVARQPVPPFRHRGLRWRRRSASRSASAQASA